MICVNSLPRVALNYNYNYYNRDLLCAPTNRTMAHYIVTTY